MGSNFPNVHDQARSGIDTEIPAVSRFVCRSDVATQRSTVSSSGWHWPQSSKLSRDSNLRREVRGVVTKIAYNVARDKARSNPSPIGEFGDRVRAELVGLLSFRPLPDAISVVAQTYRNVAVEDYRGLYLLLGGSGLSRRTHKIAKRS